MYDTKSRVVSLENLKAMCRHSSGTCHRFTVTKVSRSRVHVEYSNPDEYGFERPMTAVCPSFPGYEADNPNVVLEYLRILHDDEYREGWQNFERLREAPTLYRDPGREERRRTHLQIRKDGGERCLKGHTAEDHEKTGWTCDECESDRPCGCTVCDLDTYKCRDCGSKWKHGNPTSSGKGKP